MRPFVLVLLLAIVTMVTSQELNTTHFSNTVILDANFQLQWNFNKTHIVFETKVQTNGYVGFGISHSGRMAPSDIVIGWISSGETHFADRHATSQDMPPLDASQDWDLLGAEESGLFTTLTFMRTLETCDLQDVAMREGTTRVIYAYYVSDPTSDDDIPYHGYANRGAKSLLLLDPPASERRAIPLPNDTFTIDFFQSNFSVPTKDTTYACMIMKLPTLSQKHHMIKYEPIVQAGHERLVHHMILYYCRVPVPDVLLNVNYECWDNGPAELQFQCDSVFTTWAIGGETVIYPEHVGHSLGTSIDPQFFRLEIHYDNPDGRSDFVDSSGHRLYLTKQLRQYDAGVLSVGAVVSISQIVPPGNSDFMSRYYCHYDCLERGMGDQPIYVFSNMLHAHLLGRKLRTRILRDGIEQPFLQEDNNYDFDYQEQRALPQEREIRKGDALIVECEYDSSQRTDLTFGGLSTRQEMCLSFLLYYPRIPMTVCWSEFVYDNVANIIPYISLMDWTQANSHKDYNNVLEGSSIRNVCNGDQRFNVSLVVTPQLTVKKAYSNPSDSLCQNAPPSSSSSLFLCSIIFLLVTFLAH